MIENKGEKQLELSVNEVTRLIYSVRGYNVVLDSDLALFYQSETKVLNQAVRRNAERFPSDFVFQLTSEEQNTLPLRTGAKKIETRGGRRTSPYGFTQEGIATLSGVLNTDRAIHVNILVMRAFVQFRQASEEHLDLVRRFDQLEKRTNEQFQGLLKAIEKPESSSFRSKPILSPLDKAQKSSPVGYIGLFDRENREKTEAILFCVAEYFNLPVSSLKVSRRTHRVVLPRQIAIYLLRKSTKMGLKEIGFLFGGKDHSTVLHSIDKVSAAIHENQAIREAVESIENTLAGLSRI